MRKLTTEIKWAVLFALTTLVWMGGEKLVGLHSTHIDQYEMASNFFALPAIAVYVLALLDKRRNDYGGYMTYTQGLLCGLLVTLFVTLLTPLTQWLTLEVISPEFLPNALRHAVASGKMTQSEAEKMFTLGSFLKQALVFTPVVGVLTSAIVALFTRRHRPEPREGRVNVVITEGPRKPAR